MTRRRRRPEAAFADGPSRWPVWAAGAAIAVAAIWVGVAATSPGTAGPRTRGSATPVGVEMLRKALSRLERCLLPAEREIALQEVAAQAPDLQPAMIWVLHQSAHPLFAPTAMLAAELGLEDTIDPLAEAAWSESGRSRRVALVALDRLQPLAVDDLVFLLGSRENLLELAALDLLGARSSVPEGVHAALLELLASPEAEARDKAMALCPRELRVELVDTVLALLDHELAGPFAEQLLGRLQPTEENTALLARRLATGDPDQQLRMVSTIDRFATAEPVREVLWQIVERGDDLTVRTQAMACLERTGDQSELPPGARLWPPSLRYQGARLRIRAGDLEGIDTLLELSTLDPESSPDADRAAGQSRVLLGRLAGLPPHADQGEYRAWRSGLTAAPVIAPGY